MFCIALRLAKPPILGKSIFLPSAIKFSRTVFASKDASVCVALAPTPPLYSGKIFLTSSLSTIAKS